MNRGSFILIFTVFVSFCDVNGLFRDSRWMRGLRTSQMNYGVATSDVNNDGRMDWIVAGYSGKNFVLTYDHSNQKLKNIAKIGTPFAPLRDKNGHAIGVSACDIDGDGREEIYFLNTNGAYAGKAAYSDKLFKWRNGSYVDLFSDQVNRNISAKDFAGRSVACIDRMGTGRYSFVLATYSNSKTGKLALIEMDETHPSNNVHTGNIVLRNSAKTAGIAMATGGRGIAVGPLLGNYGASDILFVNEGNPWMGLPGDNFLFENLGNGKFKDVAKQANILDSSENGRGVALADLNEDGLIDVVYGNWKGKHKIYVQYTSSNGTAKFRNEAPSGFSEPSPVRTVMVNDFDNDGRTEIFFNNICGRYSNDRRQPNRLFSVVKSRSRLETNSINVRPEDIGQALEPYGCGTGGSYADMDGDGKLDIILSHGESGQQPLTVYHSYASRRNNWIRIFPKTVYGAPARGATVTITLNNGRHLTQVIDGGSGYLCQMEPIAHFGLGRRHRVQSFHIQWPDGRTYDKILNFADINQVHVVGWGRSS